MLGKGIIMAYLALYRRWRPAVFEDVVEQEHVVKTLKNSVSSGRIAHAYLFCGTRGTGKTTMAKIFSRAINCLNPLNGDPCNECEICKGILQENILDVIEIDAASNNGVDNIREIRDEVVYTPSRAKYKVYIIDEVHMLSTGAFNALLKTLEEPPAHAVFILATTDPNKLPATVLSRCQRFDFRRITVESIIGRLNLIAKDSGVSIQKEAARLIAKLSEGALRDAISILDQCLSISSKEVTYNDVLAIVGIVKDAFIAEVIDEIRRKDLHKLLIHLEELVMDGKDIKQFVSDLIFYLRNLLICKIDKNPGEIVDVSAEALSIMIEQSSGFERDEIVFIIMELSSLEQALKWAAHPRVLTEIALIKICERSIIFENSGILERLSALENKLNSTEPIPRLTVQGSGTEKSDNSSYSEREKKTAQKRIMEDNTSVIAGKSKGLDNWDEILVELKNSGRMVIFTNLLGTKAVELDSKFIGIVFSESSNFSKDLISRHENLEVIEGILSKKLEKPMRVKCLLSEDLKGRQSKTKEEDEFIDKAKEIAEKFNVPVNIIDE
jgi:DNA polymerase-3 subunit gamma/tau